MSTRRVSRIGNNLRNHVIEQLRYGATPKDLVRSLRISESSIYRIQQTYKIFGTVNPTLWVKGRLKTIYTTAAKGLLDMLNQEPQASLADFQDLLETEYNIKVSKVAISKKLKQLKITYKRVERTNQAQDLELRADYISRIYEYNAEQVVFVDESVANEHTAYSRYS
jgi:transposase